jgi:hypothetical protein
MASPPMPDPEPRMRVRLRKPHACGGTSFVVSSTGADIRLFCEKCGAKIFIDRARWRTRAVEVLPATPAAD